ncbi:PLD nuclease N-terminal domain-containing protein [Polaribacter sp. PL03]|uniref:PLD nuclease N-terminal domain-containing protein n=1 Tax=Polaribacter sp. PL03 TaxID=3088353 RepID=UPI0029D1E36F|nr:PLD nuclease N-terminal domain-containing protein [Polaribacter sp. PL03]MDX6748108.1 PLD nuclease N-terminal domain-containing protein [Polaribacter sp. PL03]
METTLIIGFVILTIILWFWAIMDITRSRFKNRNMNTIWLLAVLFFPVLGSIFYFQLRKKFVTKEKRKFQPNFNRAELKTTE